ncbi:MAG: FAD-dependent monooxygenase [Gemmatimonadaceae bacterium]|nr:FAD-dependent monooxygenase [Gemmatimonadaceae bacterium]
MRIEDMRVTVVGAGVGGCAAALMMARAGATVTLLERVERAQAVGAGIAIAANGFAVLESLGLGPALTDARPVAEPRIVDGSGRTLLRPPGDAGVRMLRRATLQRVLLDAVAAEPGIQTCFGAELIQAAADGTAFVAQVDGTERAITADLLIGADGVHSRLRAGLDVGARLQPDGIAYVRALVPARALNEEAWCSAGVFGSFDVDNGAYLYASAGTPSTAAAVERHDLAAFCSAWSRAYPAAAPLLQQLTSWNELILNRVTTVHCARWSQDRAVLLGDAAHAMAPNLGQGGNSALVDAAVLVDELFKSPDLRAGLLSYERRRGPAVAKVAALSARLGALAEETRSVPRWLRDRVLLPLAGRLGGDPTAQVLQESPETLRAIGRRAAVRRPATLATSDRASLA